MKILGLDISTKTGWALLNDDNLTAFGLLRSDLDYSKEPSEDYEYLVRAIGMAQKIAEIVLKYEPDLIYIEQTNKGRQRMIQKLLEFHHFAILSSLRDLGYSSKVCYIDTSAWRKELGVKLSAEDRKRNKEIRRKKTRGKITTKHVAVRWVNSEFGLEFKVKDNDIADAICLAVAGRKTRHHHVNDIASSKIADLFKE